MAQFSNRFNIIDSYRLLPPAREYDLMIVDGGSGKTNDVHDGGDRISAWLFINYLESIKTIYFEGRRKSQRMMISKALVKKYKINVTTYADVNFNGIAHKGGVEIKCEKCISGIIRLASFVKSMNWALVKNPLIYRLRSIKNKFFAL